MLQDLVIFISISIFVFLFLLFLFGRDKECFTNPNSLIIRPNSQISLNYEKIYQDTLQEMELDQEKINKKREEIRKNKNYDVSSPIFNR
jgi:predicted RND superfamily exporter protein